MSALFSQLHQLGLETFLPMLMGLEIIFMGLLLGWDSWTTFRWIPGVKSHGQWALGWLWFVVISSCVCVGAWFFGLYPFFLSNILMGSKMYKRWLQQYDKNESRFPLSLTPGVHLHQMVFSVIMWCIIFEGRQCASFLSRENS